MESNHPFTINHKPPSSTIATPNFSYFRDNLRSAGHMEPAYGGHAQLGGPSYQWVNHYHRHPVGMDETVWRQIEKERIREQIIAEEIARRRILEAEVRRELLIERNMSMQRRIDGSIYTSYMKPMIVDPKGFPHPTPPQEMEESSERTGMSTLVRNQFGSSETESQRGAEARTSKFVTPPDTVKEKEKIILTAKTEENISGMKRKAEVLPSISAKRKAEVSPSVGASELTSASAALKKKEKEEFSCALCQVSTTSERALKEHLQGKKHKAKEAGLKKNEKRFSIGLYPKMISMPTELSKIPTETNNDSVVTKSGQLDQALKKNKAPACRTLSGRSPKEQKNFKFWCEMCQVGAFSENVMEAHRKGKKHLALLLKQNTVSKPLTQINITEEADEVVEGTTSRDSAPIIDDVKLDVASKGLGGVADEVELEGNQTRL